LARIEKGAVIKLCRAAPKIQLAEIIVLPPGLASQFHAVVDLLR